MRNFFGNKFRVFMSLGFIISMLVAGGLAWIFRADILGDVPGAAIGFVTSLVEDLFFFGLVGLALAIAQFSNTGGDSLNLRLRRLFSNPGVDDAVISYFVDQVRRNGVYAERANHHVTVLEYDRARRAYRLDFENDYLLHNAFGDQLYEADMTMEIAPDFVSNTDETVASVVAVWTEENGQSNSIVQSPEPIPNRGLRIPARISLKPDQRLRFVAKWWSFAANTGDSGFSVKRFSKSFRITIENKCPVTVRLRYGDGCAKEAALAYGEVLTIEERQNVPERVRVEFQWMPPAEHDDLCASQAEQGAQTMLEYDRKISDPDTPTL